MPTVLRSGPNRFFVYSADGGEPPHIHVEREACVAKLWLHPVRVARSGGFGARELRQIERLVSENEAMLQETWDEHFERRLEGSGRRFSLGNGRRAGGRFERWAHDRRAVGLVPAVARGFPLERENWRLIGGGEGIHWPDVEEDISIESLIAGRPSAETAASLAKWLARRKS